LEFLDELFKLAILNTFKELKEMSKESQDQTGLVAHTCNSSYSGDKDQEDCDSRSDLAKSQ
jgi:hypothetical protein